MKNNPRQIIATRGDECHKFDSIVACARFFETNPYSISRELALQRPINGWRLAITVREVNKTAILHSNSVIAITKDGTKVRFSSAVEASEYLKFPLYKISDALSRKGICGGWRWKYDDGEEDAVPCTDRVACKFNAPPPIHRRPRKKESDSGTDDDTEANPYEDQEPYAVGYYNEGFAPAICPVCDLVVGSSHKVIQCAEKHGFNYYHDKRTFKFYIYKK